MADSQVWLTDTPKKMGAEATQRLRVRVLRKPGAVEPGARRRQVVMQRFQILYDHSQSGNGLPRSAIVAFRSASSDHSSFKSHHLYKTTPPYPQTSIFLFLIHASSQTTPVHLAFQLHPPSCSRPIATPSSSRAAHSFSSPAPPLYVRHPHPRRPVWIIFKVLYYDLPRPAV